MPNDRLRALKTLLDKRRFVRAIEVHNGLSAIIGNDVCIQDSNEKIEFGALWVSSLTETASKGHPDAEILGFNSRLKTINEVAEVSCKPIIVDGDTGMDFNHFEYMVRKLERAGVSAVIIEDKVFPKRNSLDGSARQTLEDPKLFANKIKRGKQIQLSECFMIIARIESLIAGLRLEDALHRAQEYLEAGADGIMIHSKSKSPANVLEFARDYENLCKDLGFRKPLVAVPTTYNMITEKELADAGFNIVIHANHMLRSACQAMENVCKIILSCGRSLPTDPYCIPVEQIFEMVGFEEVKKRDKETEELLRSKLRVVIPAAGEHPDLKSVSGNTPCCMLDINGKTILQRQIEVVKKFNLSNIVVVRGYQKDSVTLDGITYYDNDDYHRTAVLSSTMKAQSEFGEGFLYLNSDIVFDDEIVRKVLQVEADMLIVVDSSFRYHKHEIDKKLDMVITKNKNIGLRSVGNIENSALRIGKEIRKELANCEFVGIAKFSKEGAANLIKIYEDCRKNQKGRFHEAISLETAGLTDMLQELIDRGFRVSVLEVHKGWLEIHNEDDYKKALKEII